MTRYSKIRFADQLKRSSIAQFFNVNSTKIRLVIIGRREGHGRERGGTEWRKKGKKEIARSYFNLNQGNHSREATFTTGNCCSRRYSSNSGGIVHWKRQGKMSFLPFPLSICSVLPSPFSPSPHNHALTPIIFQTRLEISATRGWTFTRENLLLYYGPRLELRNSLDLCSREWFFTQVKKRVWPIVTWFFFSITYKTFVVRLWTIEFLLFC